MLAPTLTGRIHHAATHSQTGVTFVAGEVGSRVSWADLYADALARRRGSPTARDRARFARRHPGPDDATIGHGHRGRVAGGSDDGGAAIADAAGLDRRVRRADAATHPAR